MRITEADQTESTGAGEPENTSLQAVANPKRPRKQTAAHVEVAKPKPADTKTDTVLKKLRLAKGATLEALELGLSLVSEVGKDGVRRYRIVSKAKAD